jgi:hypothetical protein
MAPITNYDQYAACRETVQALARQEQREGLSEAEKMQYYELRARVAEYEKDGRFPGHVNKTGNEY